jgi:diamine N-acetyltransferase
MAIHLHEASEAELPAIASLAHTIWNQHYPAIVGQAQVDYMLELFYNANSLKEQVVKKKHRFFLIRDHSINLGFVSVSQEQAGSWFLHKFYIDQGRAGKGAGTEAFRQLLGILAPGELRLTVNRQNYKSINFYFKNGFTIEKVADFDIGEGYVMNDFVMVWKRYKRGALDTSGV